MENLPEKIARLLNKAEWSDDDKEWLLNYLEETNATELRQLMEKKFEAGRQARIEVDPRLAQTMLQELLVEVGVERRTGNVPVTYMRRWFLAAGVLVIVSTAGLLRWFQHDTGKEMVKTPVSNIARPLKPTVISKKVVLTMSDGRALELGDGKAGELPDQGNSKLLNQEGKLVYQANAAKNESSVYNTITTPAGTNYQVQLPDGSNVWLNATSSIHFPTAFTGNNRSVDITGEAYFEVVKNAAKPFIVHVQGAEIRVAGTHFNVMAYANETAIKTTLLEGAVTFSNGGNNCSLKPGQQGQLVNSKPIKLINDIDVTEVMAWKNGLFDFDGAGIETVARQLSRWYDVEIVFDKSIHNRFYAKIPRNTKLADVLKALALTGKVQFAIEGNKITTMPAD